ncbi:MAG TPA: NAD(P)/FAD-dependent oxidoreductase [Candidatus Binataceae bacterium]|nr:NAD(P)/FAD-dependent oxidoreductase [Candidatus Binataceae bacterium]
MANKKVIVVGGGVAGLAAAYRLRKAGVDVSVLESSDRVGGRIGTDSRDGFTIERGAQLITSTYRNTLRLVKELGLEADLKPTTPWMATVKDGIPRRVPSGAMFPIYAVTSGLLGIPDMLRFIWHTTKLKWPPVDNYSAWAEYDDEDTASWFTPRVGAATTYLVEPLVAGGLLQRMEETSRALTLATLALTDNGRSKEMTLTRGMGSLPEALASRVEVKLESPAQSIEADAEGVTIQLSGERMRADHVILATTAPIAARLYGGEDELERKLMGTKYSSTIRVGLATSRHWREEPALKNVWAFLVPRPDRKLIVSATVESTKSIERAPEGELLNLFVGPEQAIGMLDLPEQEIVDAVLPDIERYFHGATATKRFAHVVRWRDALPKCPVGHSRDLAEYRRSRPHDRRVMLAGDYLGMPSFESAIETGFWAADAILRK